MQRLESLDFREIDTPWEPQPISWRMKNGERSGVEQLVEQVSDPSNTHVVREVEVAVSPVAGLISVADTRIDLQIADQQFAHIGSYPGIAIADHEWHVFQDPEGRTRTLARVEIIDGIKLTKPTPETFRTLPADEQQALAEFAEFKNRYAREVIGLPLVDIYELYQWHFGVPRTHTPNPMAVKALTLIDIEPMFFLRGRLH